MENVEEVKEKKEGFFKRLNGDVKLQVLFCVVSVAVLVALYVPVYVMVDNNALTRRILNKNVEDISAFLANVEKVEVEDGDLELSGWFLYPRTEMIDTKVILISEDEEDVYVLDINQIENENVIGYANALFVDGTAINSGYTSTVEVERLDSDTCYEVFLYMVCKEENQEIEKKILTSKYLYNNELYSYNPTEFVAPAFVDVCMDYVVSNGTLMGYDMENRAWVYMSEGYLYWILDKSVERNIYSDIYVFFHLSTSCNDLLPKWRQQYGFDNQDFEFSTKERIFESEEKYRVAIEKIEADYPITYISTGQYADGKNIWSIKTRMNFD